MLRATVAGSIIVISVLALGMSPFALAQDTDDGDDTEEVREIVVEAVIEPPDVPEDPLALAAYNALDRNCARCHQAGALTDGRLKPSKDFGFVLDLEQLSHTPKYVVPGNPDGSHLVEVILNQQMPYDLYQDGDFAHAPPPSAEEVAALRDWISELGADTRMACADREPTRLDDVVTLIANDLDVLDKDRVANTRYLTLTHLANTCTSDEAMEVFRQGAVKLLNSMSLSSNLVELETIDEDGTILRFNLRDMGWEAEDWETVLEAYPYAVLPDTQMATAIGAITYTSLPFVRADWFAATVSQPPLYHDLLKLPEHFDELQYNLGVDVAANIYAGEADRAGFQVSGVSANNRLIERHAISTGYFWTSYDFGANRDRQSLFEFPLGPGDGDFDFAHDGGETIFSLPNGFQAYYLNDADGTRIDRGPTNIVRDQSRRDLAVTNGISCIGCHNLGMRRAVDEIGPHVASNRSFPRDVRDAVDALYPSKEVMDRILTRDGNRFASAMKEAGLDPTLTLNGIEMTTSLANYYDQDVTIEAAASEFDMSVDEFIEAVHSAGDRQAARLGRRLEQGLVPRDTFEEIYPDIVELVADLERPDGIRDYREPPEPKEPVYEAPPVKDDHKEDDDYKEVEAYVPPPKRTEIDLALTSDKTSYYKDDLAVFTVTTNIDCYLTLLNVDRKGTATVLFPNKFEGDNYLRAGSTFDFPGRNAGFQFRLGDVGTETVIAICDEDRRIADHIELDPKEVLTVLGDYEKYLSRSITIEAAAPHDPAPKKGGKGQVARTAIKFDVR